MAASAQVSGCDLVANATVHITGGVPVALGHDPAHLVTVDVVVVSAGCRLIILKFWLLNR